MDKRAVISAKAGIQQSFYRRNVTLQSRGGGARGKFGCGLGVRAVRAGSIGRDGQRLGESADPPQGMRAALATAPSTKKPAPYGSKRTARTPKACAPLLYARP